MFKAALLCFGEQSLNPAYPVSTVHCPHINLQFIHDPTKRKPLIAQNFSWFPLSSHYHIAALVSNINLEA